MRLVGPERDDPRGDCEGKPLRGEQVDEREHAALRQHRKREQQQNRREQVDELRVERGSGHDQLPRSWVTSMPSTASRNAVPRDSGARKIRIFAESVSISANAAPPIASFAISAGAAPSISRQSPPASAMPIGKNNASPMHE